MLVFLKNVLIMFYDVKVFLNYVQVLMVFFLMFNVLNYIQVRDNHYCGVNSVASGFRVLSMLVSCSSTGTITHTP